MSLMIAAAFASPIAAASAQNFSAPIRMDAGRFTFVSYPSDSALAQSLLRRSLANDTFPGLPRPRDQVVVAVAPNAAMFREWIGPNVPEWGAAVAFPALRRIVIQGRDGARGAGDPRVVLRHELAHLALYESLGQMPPRWFDEGYASHAAGEWDREVGISASLMVLTDGVPALDALDTGFGWNSGRARASYALAHLAVAELDGLDRERGLTLFFNYWREGRSFERAVRRAYGLTVEDFEARWKRTVMRRYGVMALLTDAGVIAALFMVLLLPFYLRRRARINDRLAALRMSEAAAERRAVSEALGKLLGDDRSG